MGGVYQSLMRMVGVWSGGVEGGAWLLLLWWWWRRREEGCAASCVAVVGQIGGHAWSPWVWRVVVWYECQVRVVIHRVIEAPC